MKKTLALRYDSRLPAPFVSAKGTGALADKIKKYARESGVPVIEKPDLAESLFYLEVGDVLPEEFYHAVAEILVYVYKIKTMFNSKV
jgi:flagellar biosynthesis protein FlhB